MKKKKDTPPTIIIQGKDAVISEPRSSNLELYRIICMLMIVAHHYVVNSGITNDDGLLWTDVTSSKNIFLLLFGAWGKTCINCFVMITGYFMCTSKITLRKFFKFMGQIYLYKILLFIPLLFAGYETLSLLRLTKLLIPTWGFGDNFVGCFIGFWLTIPFLNILIQNLTKKQHRLLLLLLLTMYTILGSIPTFNVMFNYVTWFGIIYFIASYIRLYPDTLFTKKNLWRNMTFFCLFLAMMSIIGLQLLLGSRKNVGLSYFFVSDCNKFFAVTIAICSFLWFKNLTFRYNKAINAFGSGTFGVLLIHANSNAMRTFLWKDTVDVIGNYSLPLIQFVLFSIGVVLIVFTLCNIIDQFRIFTFEKWFLGWYDNKIACKANGFAEKILINL